MSTVKHHSYQLKVMYRLTSTQVRQYVEILRFWNRVIRMDTTRLTRKIFGYDYMKCKFNWSSDVKEIFMIAGHIDLFSNKSTCDIKCMKDSLTSHYSAKWLQDVQQKPKLRTYILFKELYSTEQYVKFCLPRKERSLLAQIRSGILPLAIETGRYRNIPAENRYCQVCTDQCGVSDSKLLDVLVIHRE